MDIITINGVDYFIPWEYSYYVTETDNTLTLNHSGNITCYSSLSEYNNSNSGYPRIQLQYGQKARYVYRSGQQTFTSDLTLNSWSINHKNLLYDPLMSVYLCIIIAIFALWGALRGHH